MTSALSRPLPEFHGFGYRIAQIENNTHCNYKCWFCPNAYDKPAPKECMSMDLFRKILLEIRSVYTPWEFNDISFATYNEPNLDDTFQEKLQLMTDMGFQYEHISNGSMVTTELTDWLIANPQNIKQFRLNIPTMDEKKWKDITGASTAVLYRMYYQLMYLFENAPRLNFPITVIVNGDGSQNHKEVNTRRATLKLLIDFHKLFFMILTTITIYNDCNRKVQSWCILKQIHQLIIHSIENSS